MKWELRFHTGENSVVQDRNFIYTIVSYSAALTIFINLNSFQSPLIGLVASAVYLLINAVFVGNALLGNESAFFRLSFGFLLLIMLLSIVGWVIQMLYNLDVIRFTFVLLTTSTLSSLLNRRLKHKNAA